MFFSGIESIHDMKSGSSSIKNGNLILSSQRQSQIGHKHDKKQEIQTLQENDQIDWKLVKIDVYYKIFKILRVNGRTICITHQKSCRA